MACIAMAFIGHTPPPPLTMATEYPATSMPGQGVSTFAELVRAKSGGEVIIEASYDAAKGIKSGDMIAAVQTRKVDAGDAFAGALAEKYPLFGVSSLPFLADSLAKARSLNKTARPAYESCWPNMARSFYTTPWPASGIWSKRKIDGLATLKSLNIRAYDATSQDVLRKAGAQAQNISFADAMPRIASGEVNAVLSGRGRKLGTPASLRRDQLRHAGLGGDDEPAGLPVAGCPRAAPSTRPPRRRKASNGNASTAGCGRTTPTCARTA